MFDDMILNCVAGSLVLILLFALIYYIDKYDRLKREFRNWQKRICNTTDMKNSQETICFCGETKYWLVEGEETVQPCPSCGRRYRGIYDPKTFQIKPLEVIA